MPRRKAAQPAAKAPAPVVLATAPVIRRRVRHWQRRLALTDWDVVVQFGPDPEGAEAACLAKPEYRTAHLLFDLAKIPAARVDRYVVHELSHCLIWALANAAHSLARGDKAAEEWVRTEEEALATRLELLLVGLP